ncbi:SAM-dependent methyltransferase [Actinocorallia longicatena]|uniref:SAM-dependent methyltransferase n=1 Tax=Actinocorallia longicatena TaxID=111803 RepID=A0ABP6Q7J9_9ACTN
MMAEHAEQPKGFDPTVPNEARVINYMMGGKDNFAADRRAAEEIMAFAPEIPMMIIEARKFLFRAVAYLAEQGIRQFVDIGCGLPAQGSVHEILERVAPGSKVAYVDDDPVVIAHSNALIDAGERLRIIQADIRDPDALLDHPDLASLIDLERPTAFLVQSMLTNILDDDLAAKIARQLVDRLPVGGYMVLTHSVGDAPKADTEKLAELFRQRYLLDGDRSGPRTRGEVARFLDGLDLVPPGLVPLPAWRPLRGEPGVDPDAFWSVGAVGRKA